MNKQELIKKYEETIYEIIATDEVLEDLKQLDEPQKPVVPQCVANWYEKNKGNFDYNLWQYLTDWEEIEPSDFKNWINEECNIFQTIVNMHQFGYTVEKEKRYLVKAKGVCFNSCLIFEKINKTWLFSSIYETDHQIGCHTRKELEEAGFGWVFDCPGIEIEEVEE